MRRLLVLGLDGATFDVIGPLVRAGKLPHLAAWMVAGSEAPLRSTVPPMSFPAWSTFLTGLGPGRHGIFDFTQKVEGAYRLRFVHAGERSGATLMTRVSRAGGRVLALGIPATHPVERVNGLVVPGFDAPLSAGSEAEATSNPALYRRLEARVGPWMRADLDESARDAAFHERAVETLLARIERKTAFAIEALRELGMDGAGHALDFATVVFAESDTVAHHYWRDHDPDSPRHDPLAGVERRSAVTRVYERLDAACGEIRAAFGPEAPCVVVSDHGSGGAAARVVHLGRRLEECGLLRRAPRGVDAAARRARDLALGVLPARAAEWAFRRVRRTAARIESAARFGGHDWRRTAAFSEQSNTQPGVWINLEGREAAGSVTTADYERVRDETIDALLDWKLPGGGPVLARVRRREEVYEGPHVARAPDIVVELGADGGYGLSLVPTPWSRAPESVRALDPDEWGGGRGRGMNGTHRPDGVWIAHGEGAPAPPPDLLPRLADVAPSLLATLGIPWEGALDGLALVPEGKYTAEQEERLAARLRALGYLE